MENSTTANTTYRVGESAVRDWLQAGLDLLYPRNCPFCDTPVAETGPTVLCQACLASVKWIEPPCCERCSLPFFGAIEGKFVCSYCHDLRFHFDGAVAACRAEGVVRDAIHQFKYNQQMYLGVHLADWITTAARRDIDPAAIDLIVPVPLHPRKRRHRQFNQAEFLAAAVSDTLGKPLCRRGVRRQKDTETQTLLDARARRQNLRDAFVVRQPEPLAGQRVLLVDDVFTTGATLDACARVLLGAGAVKVTVLTVARGI